MAIFSGSLAKINESSALASSYLWHQYLNGVNVNIIEAEEIVN
jgi:hypothetical protein